jgi:hypothetical protein
MRTRISKYLAVTALLAVSVACAKAGADQQTDTSDGQQKAAMAAAGINNLSGSVGATASITSPETITTVGRVVKEKGVDLGKPGPSVGDTFAWTLDIKSQAGVDLGTERTQCTVGVDGWAICIGTFDITGRGEIVAMGAFVNFGSERVDFDVPITGGTGDFANVRGVVHVHLTENREIDTLELLP